MSEKQETVFVDGLFFNKKHENAPDFVKGGISMKVDEIVPFLEKHKNSDGYVKADLLVSREGKLYFKLNTFVPKKVEEEVVKDEISILVCQMCQTKKQRI